MVMSGTTSTVMLRVPCKWPVQADIGTLVKAWPRSAFIQLSGRSLHSGIQQRSYQGHSV